MKISLNRHDLHTAIREYLTHRNIATDTTELDISIKAVKGGQPSADISVVDNVSTNHNPIDTTESTQKTDSPFGDRLKGV